MPHLLSRKPFIFIKLFLFIFHFSFADSGIRATNSSKHPKHGGRANLANDMTVPENTTRPADPDVCDYRIQGTEFDPIFGPGERENFVSLQYVLKRLLPNPTLISEDFNS